jgi:argininosuccinate lyase
VIGQLTAYCLENEKDFPDLTDEEFGQFSEAFGPDVRKVLDVTTALKARKAIGAPSPGNVGRQLSRWQRRLVNPPKL